MAKQAGRRHAWSWNSADVSSRDRDAHTPSIPGHFDSDGPGVTDDHQDHTFRTDSTRPRTQEAKPKIKREYTPRQCRICLEVVLPSFDRGEAGVASMLHPSPKVSYISEDPASGRLIRPCHCRGSQRYVHEGCLQAWRYSNAAVGQKNMWQCPTCRFKYRLERLRFARILSSTATEIALTLLIMLLTTWFFGFIADPIIDLYLDPIATITTLPTGRRARYIIDDDPVSTWTEHWIKGFASLGLMGFVKVIFTMPWWNIRGGGNLGGLGRGRALGRNRLESISWGVVFAGIITFLYVVWKWVRAWCRRSLQAAGERVADVQGDDKDADEDDVGD